MFTPSWALGACTWTELTIFIFHGTKQWETFDPFWAPRVPLFHDSFMVVEAKMLVFGHFGLKIKPLQLWNLTKNSWDYKTRAQELTSVAIHMLLSSFVKIWEHHFKDEAHEGQIAALISVAILTFFTNFNISWLWIDESAWNWWSNWRVFAALADGK